MHCQIWTIVWSCQSITVLCGRLYEFRHEHPTWGAILHLHSVWMDGRRSASVNPCLFSEVDLVLKLRHDLYQATVHLDDICLAVHALQPARFRPRIALVPITIAPVMQDFMLPLRWTWTMRKKSSLTHLHFRLKSNMDLICMLHTQRLMHSDLRRSPTGSHRISHGSNMK